MREGMRLTIGVIGLASGPQDAEDVESDMMFVQLGCAIAQCGHILLTSACPGLPLAVARGAQAAGGLSIGISPGRSSEEHVYKYHLPTDAYDVLIYAGSGHRGRAALTMRSSHIIIFAEGVEGHAVARDERAVTQRHKGHAETLDEFANACNEDRLIGVLTWSGGVADRRTELARYRRKNTNATDAVVLFGADPARLIARLTASYRRRYARRPTGIRAASGDQAFTLRAQSAELMQQTKSEDIRARTSRRTSWRSNGGQKE
jgi:hypothetical protein